MDSDSAESLDQDQDKAIHSDLIGRLKSDINEFVWSRLPAETTLGEMEELTISFYDAIFKAWSRHGFEL